MENPGELKLADFILWYGHLPPEEVLEHPLLDVLDPQLVHDLLDVAIAVWAESQYS